MQTFDLHNEDSETEDSGFVIYWKASNELYDIILESNTLFRRKDSGERLTELALQASKPILTLQEAQIPERYWHPDIMNWLLFTSYKNRNFTISYLITLYEEYTKKEFSTLNKLKIQNICMKYQHSVKKLMKY